MGTERQITLEAIQALAVSGEGLPDEIKGQVAELFRYIQAAVNAFAEDQDRVIDTLVVQAALQLATEEHSRVCAKLAEAGLLPEN